MQTLQKQKQLTMQSEHQLALNPPLQEQLLTNFVQSMQDAQGQESLASPALHQRASSFLAGSFQPISFLRLQQRQYTTALDQLAEVRSTITQQQKTANMLSAAEQLAQQRVLDSKLAPLRELCELSHSHKRAEVPTYELLTVEVDLMTDVLSSELAHSHEIVRPYLAAFTELAQQKWQALSQQRTSEHNEQLLRANLTYYPRGMSPEAEASHAGLFLEVGRGPQTAQILEQYVATETNVSQSLNGYFRDLQRAKQAVQAAREDLKALRELRDTYQRSGSSALSYFANLNCIVAGDTSHTTLYQASEQANVIGASQHLSEFLEKFPTSLQTPVLQFHRWRLAIQRGDHASAVRLEAGIPVKSAEGFLVAAQQKDMLGDHRFASDLAFSASQEACKQYPEDPRLYIEARWICLRGARDRDGLTKLAKKAPDDTRVVGELMATLFENKSSWEVVEETLEVTRRCHRAWVLAGDKAYELGDLPRARRYYEKAKTLDPRSAEPVIALAQTYQHTEPEIWRKHIEEARQLAPHYPALVSLDAVEQGGSNLLPTRSLKWSKSGALPKWTEKVQTQIVAAMHDAQHFQERLLECDAYAAARTLLSPDSVLASSQSLAIELLERKCADVDAVLAVSPCKHAVWQLWCGRLYDELEPCSVNSDFGVLTSCVRELSASLRELDPNDDYFFGAHCYPRLESLIKKARAIWLELTRADETSSDVSQAQLRALRGCLGEVLKVLKVDLKSGLRQSEAALEQWTSDMQQAIG
jgi:tetratricopeptide (TPR) repeat protein